MTKSIEEQAKEYASEDIEMMLTPNTINFEWLCKKQDFIAGAKARDVQWQTVVNELREALKFYAADINWNSIGHFINSRIDSTDMDNIEPFDNSYQFGGKKARQSLTKADQMLKEMGIKL